MRKHWTWILPLAVAMTIFWLSSRSQLPFNVPLPHPLDKVAHATVFAAFAWALDFTLAAEGIGLPIWRRIVLVLVVTSAFGATDEWHQYYVPGRACEWGDWIADTLGGALGLLLQNLPMLWSRSRDRVRARRPSTQGYPLETEKK